MASPRPARPLRRLCHSNLVHPRNRNTPHVRRTNGLRRLEFRSKTPSKRRETQTNAWEGVRHAFITRPIRGIFLRQPDAVLAVQTCAQTGYPFAYAVEHVG